MENLELTGKVELDKASLRRLYDAVREDVVNDTQTSGYVTDELIKILSQASPETYLKILTDTIDNICLKIEENVLTTSPEYVMNRQLLAISNILKISLSTSNI